MTEPCEIELKLAFDPDDHDRLDAAPLIDGDARVEHLVATYFDTPEREVRGAGYALRIRCEGGARVQSVKAAGGGAVGLFARGEWERDVRDDRPVLDARSGPLAQIIGHDAAARLDPLFVTDVRRTTRALDIEGVRFACTIDMGEIRAGKRHLALHEIELELEGGTARPLFDFARRLDRVVPLRLAALSKAERGYALAEDRIDRPAKGEPVTLDPNGTTGEAFQVIARSCLRQFRRNEDILLRTGDAEPLHQARVGLRRLRTAFSLFKPLTAGEDRADLLRAELRWLAVELGKLRNLDVLIAQADPMLHEQLAVARDRLFEQVREALNSTRSRALMIDLAEWLAFGDWLSPANAAAHHRDIEPFVTDLLERRWRQLRHRGKRLAELDDGHRHKVRIAAKKLRYAAQFFTSLYQTGKARRRCKRILDALETLQDQLGALNDLVIASQILASLHIDASPPGADKSEQMLRRAEEAYDALVAARRFWR